MFLGVIVFFIVAGYAEAYFMDSIHPRVTA